MKKELNLPTKRNSGSRARRRPQSTGRAGDPLEIQIDTLRTLLFAPLYPVKFSAAFRVILELGVVSDGWRAAFEHAYDRLPANKRIHVRDEMADLYVHFGEHQMAAGFLAPEPSTIPELETALRVNLALERFDAAAAVADKCLAKLPAVEGTCHERKLRVALAVYHSELGQWEQAVTVWEGAKLSNNVNPFVEGAQLHVRRAMRTVRHGLAVICECQARERGLQRTKRQDRSFVEAEQALKQFANALSRIVPTAADLESEYRPAEKKLPVVSPSYDARSALGGLIASLDKESEQRAMHESGPTAVESAQT